MASSPVPDQSNLSSMGNSSDRLICESSIKSGTNVCFSRPAGSPGRIHRCFLQNLDIQAGLGVSPSSITPSGPSSSEPLPPRESLPDSGSKMGESLLESGPQKSGPCSSSSDLRHSSSFSEPDKLLTTQRPPPHVQDLILEVWLVRGGPPRCRIGQKEMSLLSAAWRPSTRSTYRKPWCR